MNNIPKGYKLVPVEPTAEMIYAIATGAHRGDTGKEIWSEALAYAADATPPQPIYDEAKERELFEALITKESEESGNGEPDLHIEEDGIYRQPYHHSAWHGWKACAQSRAKSVEVGHE